MELTHSKQKEDIESNQGSIQEESKQLTAKSNRNLKIFGVVLAIFITVIAILVTLYFFGIFQKNSCGRNMDSSCNCKAGYYKSGKNCVGPFNEDIFTKEDIHISLKGQDENLAPKIAKRHLEQVYHYTVNSYEDHQFYSQPSKIVDQTSSHEIRVVTEEVNEDKFILFAYLSHTNYTDPEGDVQKVEGYPFESITKSDEADQDKQQDEDDFDLDKMLTQWQKRESQKYNITYEEYFSSQTPMVRVELNKQGKILNLEVPINIREKFEEILINFLEHYSPDLSKYHYKVHQYIDENGDEIEEIIESGDEENINDITSKAELLDNEVILKEAYNKNILANKENQTPNQNIIQQRNSKSGQGQIENGQEEVDLKYFHTRDDEKLGLKKMDIKFKVQLQLQDFNLIKEEKLTDIEEDFKLNHVIQLTKQQYQQRKQEKMDSEDQHDNSQLQQQQDEDDFDKNRRILQQNNELFNEKDMKIFDMDFLGLPFSGGSKFICRKHHSKIGYFLCQQQPYWSLLGWQNNLSSGEFEVDARASSMTHPTVVFVDKELFKVEKKFEKKFPTPIGIPLFIELKFLFKAEFKVYATLRDIKTIDLTAALPYDVSLAAYAGADAGIVRAFLYAKFDIASGVARFNFVLITNDLIQGEIRMQLKAEFDLYPVKITYGIFYQFRVITIKFHCFSCLFFKCCIPYPTLDWGPEKPILGPYEETFKGYTLLLFEFQVIFNENNDDIDIIGDDSQKGNFNKADITPLNDNMCKVIEIQSAGQTDGDFVVMKVDGQNQVIDNINGFHIMVFDFITLKKKYYRTFDTYHNSAHINDMINFIKSLNNGDFVAISIRGKQTTTEEIYNTFSEYLGLDHRFTWQASYAAFSQIGRSKGVYDHFYENENKQAKVISKFCQYDTDWISVDYFQNYSIRILKNGQQTGYSSIQKESIFFQTFDPISLQPTSFKEFKYQYLIGAFGENYGPGLISYVDNIVYGDLVIFGILGNIPSFPNDTKLHDLIRNELGLSDIPQNNEHIIAISRKGYPRGSALANSKFQNMGQIAISGSFQMLQLEKQNICKTFETQSVDYMSNTNLLIDGILQDEQQEIGVTYWIYDSYTLEFKERIHYNKDLLKYQPTLNQILLDKTPGIGDIVIITTKWVHGQENQSYDIWGYKMFLGFKEYLQPQYVLTAITQKQFNDPLIDQYHVNYNLQLDLEQNSYVDLQENLGIKAKFCSLTEPQNYFYLSANGKPGELQFVVKRNNTQIFYQSSNRNALHLSVIDKDSHSMKSNQIFDFSNDIELAYKQLAFYVNQISEGDIVAYGVTGNQQINQQSIKVLENYLGYDSQQYPMEQGDTIVAWGRKGYSQGRATILRKANGKGIAQIKVSPDIEPVSLDIFCKNIHVVSAGFESGDFIKLYEDGVEVTVEQKRGVHIFVYDQFTLERKFQTYYDWQYGQELVNFIDNVFKGDYVFIGVKDNGHYQMMHGGQEAVKKLGINHNFTENESFAAIGQRGILQAVIDSQPKEKQIQAEVKGNICSRDKTHFNIESQGNWDGKKFDVLKDGVSQIPLNNTNSTKEGFNIAVFDQNTYNLTSFETFQNDASNATQLINYVENITYGDLVAYGIDENAQELLTGYVQSKLEETIGFDSYSYKIKKGDSLSGWGRKGLKKGEGMILKKVGTKGGANILGSSKIYSKNEEKANCKKIDIKSNGGINYLEFFIDEIQLTTYKNKEGIHLIVFDKYTLNKKNMTFCNTYTDSSLNEAQKLVEFIDHIQDGDIVIYGVHTDASKYMTQAGYDALKQIGMDQQLQLNDSLAGIGVKGFPNRIYEKNSIEQGIDLDQQYAQIKTIICAQNHYESIDYDQFTIISETFPDTDTVNQSYFKVMNGNVTLYEVQNQTGMVVVIIDQHTRQVKKSKITDITTKWWELTDFVNLAQNGDYVAYGSAKNINVTDYGEKELFENKLGYDFDKYPFKIGYGLAAIARKGFTKGQAVIQDRNPISGKAIASLSARVPLTMPNDQNFCKNIYIESQGLQDGDYSNIYVNGQLIGKDQDDSNSIFLVVFDQYTLELKLKHVFQTGSYDLAYQYMTQRIDSISDGDYVALTVRGDAQQYMNTEGFQALSSLGINTQFGRNDSFAAFTRKGSQQPALIETFQSGQGKKAIVQGNFCSDDGSDNMLYLVKFDNTDVNQNYTLDIQYGDQSLNSYSSSEEQLIFVVIDHKTNQVNQTQTYQNINDIQQQQNAIEFLKSLSKDDLVIYTLARLNSIQLGLDLNYALENILGYSKEAQILNNDSMVAIARVGMSRGLAEMHIRKINKGPAILFSSPNLQVPNMGKICKPIVVTSNNVQNGNQVSRRIEKDWYPISANETQGLYFMILDQFNLEIKQQDNFNPSNATEVTNMIAFIDNISNGDYVAFAVKEDGSALNQQGYDALKTIGINEQFGYGESYAALGRKGISKAVFDQQSNTTIYWSQVKTNMCAQEENFIQVESLGKKDNNNYFRVELNGQDIYWSNSRGIHYVVLDQDTLEIKSEKVFNVYDHPEENQAMSEFIQMIPLGDIVAYGVSEYGCQQLSNESVKIMEDNIGFEKNGSFLLNDSIAVIGRKGQTKMQALIHHKQLTGPAKIYTNSVQNILYPL